MIKSMAHVAIATLDMDRARKFYEHTLGLKVVADFVLDDRGVDQIVELENARFHIVLLRAGDDSSHPVVELTCYERPKGKPLPADFKYNNVGCSHICFWVDDLDAEYRRLSDQGVRFNCKPKVLTIDGLGTLKAAYLRDPDGVTIELLQAMR